MNLCSKPGCANVGASLLSYDYAGRIATLQDPVAGQGEISPHLYVLCARCAEALTAPRGWAIEDRREVPPLFVAAGDGLSLATTGEPAEEPSETSRQLFFGCSA